jgi:UDP-3-O-[3-hydroxymyristoyl] glucosamine N-acyltransferase
VSRLAPVSEAGAGDLAPVLSARYVRQAALAAERGACLLVDGALGGRAELHSATRWVHPFAGWVMAELLDACDVPEAPARVGLRCTIGLGVVLEPRVVVGDYVVIDAHTVIGRPGFGWVTGEGGKTRRVPQLGGVVIEAGAVIGPLSSIDAGTLSPTVIGRGAKLDAQVHVGHNVTIGDGTIVAAQSGFAGSVHVGKGVLIGGQVGVADHVTIGDGARIAAKSGVIGDVPPGAVVAGYPAVPRARWLRGLARLYRSLRT